MWWFAAGLGAGAPLAAWQIGQLRVGAYRNPTRFERLTFNAIATLVVSTAGELAAFSWLGRGH